MASKKRRSGAASVVELFVIVAVALGLALGIQAFLFKPFRIPSESMVPTLMKGERVIVNRVVYRLHPPRRGNIVVFHPPAGADLGPPNDCGVQHSLRSVCPEPTDERSKNNFIKRVVGLPGDRLSIRNGHPVINGKELQETYAQPCGTAAFCNLPRTIKIPAGYFFMMGDNRGRSDDSRIWGPVPKKWIIGKAFFSYWPPNQIGPP